MYIGEFNSGASAVSIPILNEAGLPQLSPANTAIGLTTGPDGAQPGEPDKYYPTGERTYARIVPQDKYQAAADISVMQDDGCTKLQLLNDKEVYGAGLAGGVEAAATTQGSRSSPTRRSTRTPPTTARWPRRPRARGPTA